jgi:hypothetical protein
MIVGSRTGDQGAGTSGALPQEVSIAAAGGSEMLIELSPDLIHRLGRREIGNDHTTVIAKDLRDLCRRRIRTDCTYCYWHIAYYTG